MHITLLGTGTSQGNPVIGCNCKVCNSGDPRDIRLRSSILIKHKSIHIVIDTGPDFRQQMLRSHNTKLDAVLFTHHHKDHIAGLDDIRPYNYQQKKAMQVYADERVLGALRSEFAYAFETDKYPGVPNIILNKIANTPFFIDNIKLVPIQIMHYKLPILGYRIENLTYITDASFISEVEIKKLKGTEILIINALRHSPHISHYNLEESLKLINKIKPRKAFLTHISHGLGTYKDLAKLLPKNIRPAYDGLSFNL